MQPPEDGVVTASNDGAQEYPLKADLARVKEGLNKDPLGCFEKPELVGCIEDKLKTK
jgi:hypothetical protein